MNTAVRLPAGLGSMVAVLGAFVALYAVAFDQGLLASQLTDLASASGGVLHEVFHDGRHLLGVPCH